MITYDTFTSSRPFLIRYSFVVGLTLTILAAFSVFFFDQPLSNYFNDDNILNIRYLAKDLTDIGLSENFFILSAVLFVIFHWIDKRTSAHPKESGRSLWHWLKCWASNFFLGLIFSGITVVLLKFIIGRQRPHRSDTFEHLIFQPFNADSYFQSLPSGHSQTLFCVATMLAVLWPRIWVLIYLLAFALAFTRVIVHAHFLSDVLMGAAVGHIATLWCLYLLYKYKPHRFSLRRIAEE